MNKCKKNYVYLCILRESVNWFNEGGSGGWSVDELACTKEGMKEDLVLSGD